MAKAARALNHSKVIRLYEIEGWGLIRIARHMGVSPSAIDQLLDRLKVKKHPKSGPPHVGRPRDRRVVKVP